MNTKLTYSSILGSALVLLTISGTAQIAHAEGPLDRPVGGGVWGVNRRVTSEPDCVGVNGTFAMDFALPSDAAGNVTAATNPRNSSPSFYLGSVGPGRSLDAAGAWRNSERVQIDAGLQWDWGGTARSLIGWTAFISVDEDQTNPAVYDANIKDYTPWRTQRRNRSAADQSYSLRGTDKAYNLDYRVTSDGAIRLDIGGLGAFYWANGQAPNTFSPSGVWPNVGVRVMDPARLAEQRVKRVTALTRNRTNTDELDGSWLKCVFRNGHVVHSNGQQDDWTTNYISGSADPRLNPTGYDAHGNGANGGGALDSIDATRNGRRTTLSRYKVDFPSLDGATPIAGTSLITAGRSFSSLNATEVNKSRYNAETVRMNLRTFQSLSGNRVRVGP